MSPALPTGHLAQCDRILVRRDASLNHAGRTVSTLSALPPIVARVDGLLGDRLDHHPPRLATRKTTEAATRITATHGTAFFRRRFARRTVRRARNTTVAVDMQTSLSPGRKA